MRKTDGCHRQRVSADDRGVPESKVKLMIAYWLHFESAGDPAAMDPARPGAWASWKFFNSTFSMKVRRGDIRTKRAYGGGTR